MSFAPTQTVHNYEILEVIEKRRTGIAYKARNLATGNVELLRALPLASAGDRESAERFLREIKVHTRLCHPNIVSFYDATQFDGQLVMAAEYVKGATLEERLRQGPLPWQQSVQLGCDLLSALEEAHALGIVHRGISPEHVILTSDGTVKLGGFGLAKPMTDMNLTQAGSILGDPRYMSPEQVTRPSEVDARADLYSVGALLFEAVTGKAPFEGRNDYEIMVAQVTAKPAAPGAGASGIPAALDEAILKALAKDPVARFQSAREFREALEKLGAPAAAAEIAVPAFCGEASQRPQAPKQGLIAALLAMLGLGKPRGERSDCPVK